MESQTKASRKRALPASQKKSHKVIEKERRQRINEKISELRRTIEADVESTPTGNISKKSQILQTTIDSIEELRRTCSLLVLEHKRLLAENKILGATIKPSTPNLVMSDHEESSEPESPLLPIKLEVNESVAPYNASFSQFERLEQYETPYSPTTLLNVASFLTLPLKSKMPFDYCSPTVAARHNEQALLKMQYEHQKLSSPPAPVIKQEKIKSEIRQQQLDIQTQIRQEIELQQEKNKKQLEHQIELIREFQSQKGTEHQQTLENYLNHLQQKKRQEELVFNSFQSQFSSPACSQGEDIQPVEGIDSLLDSKDFQFSAFGSSSTLSTDFSEQLFDLPLLDNYSY